MAQKIKKGFFKILPWSVVIFLVVGVSVTFLSPAPNNPDVQPAKAADTILSSVYIDDGDGTVERIRWTMDETVTACAYEAGDWTVNTAGSINVAITGLICTGSDAFLNILVAADGYETGGAIDPIISYADAGTLGSVTLTSGNMGAHAAVTATDGAAPVVVNCFFKDITTVDGQVDRVDITFSETVQLINPYEDADWSFPLPGDIGLTNETNATVVGSDVRLTTSGDANETGNIVNGSRVQYDAANGVANSLKDNAATPNAVASFAVSVSDNAAPYPVSSVYKDADSNGTVDRIDITMTADAGLACSFNAADWSIPTPGSINANTPASCTAVGNDLRIGVSANANETGGTTNPTILYTNNFSRVRDGAFIYTATFSSAVTATDGAVPVVVSTTPINNAVSVPIDQALIWNFSEPMVATFVYGVEIVGNEFISNPTPSANPADWTATWNISGTTVSVAHPDYSYGTPINITTHNANVHPAVEPLTELSAIGPVPDDWSFTTLSSGGGGRGASVVGTVVINNDAATTSNPNVTLTLTGTNATEMVIGNDPNFIGSSWETFATSKTWTLTSGDGVKTVYTKFKDSAGNLSQTASDTITRTLPTVSDEYSFVTASPISVVADGASESTITADVRDGSNAPMSGKTVTISSSRGTLDTITTVTGTTGVDGVATFKVKSGTAGTSTFTATVDSVVIITAASVVFTAPGAPSEVPPGEVPVGLSVGDLIKSSISSTVYYYGSDNKRHIFPNSLTYRTWYLDWSGVKVIPQSQLQGIALGKNVTMRHGTVLVKIESDPKVYAVEPGGILRWIPTEARAIALYGPYWTKRVIDVPAVFWGDYTFGADITTDTHPTGALIQYAGLPDIYYIRGAEKRHIATESAFIVNNFRWINVLTVPTAFYYSTGADITGREPDLASIYQDFGFCYLLKTQPF